MAGGTRTRIHDHGRHRSTSELPLQDLRPTFASQKPAGCDPARAIFLAPQRDSTERTSVTSRALTVRVAYVAVLGIPRTLSDTATE